MYNKVSEKVQEKNNSASIINFLLVAFIFYVASVFMRPSDNVHNLPEAATVVYEEVLL